MATVALTVADDGGTVEVSDADTLELSLRDNPTTGYRWELEPIAGASLRLVDERHEPDSDLTGSGGRVTWTLHAAVPGNVALRLKQWRPWEGESSVLARFAVTIVVRG